MTPPALSVGIDLVEVAQVAEAIARFGDRYLRRVYTDEELATCAGSPARLAARFAAKEAAFKALRQGDAAISWRDIGVTTTRGAAPSLTLTGTARTLADRAGLDTFAVSLSHDAGRAVAVVIAQPSGVPTR